MKQTTIMRILIFIFLYGVALTSLVPLFFLRPGVFEGSNSFVNMIYGTADRPFIRRTLAPSAIRYLVTISEKTYSITGKDLATHPVSRLGDRLMSITNAPQSARIYGHEHGVCALFFAGCFVGFGCTLRNLIRHFYPEYPGFVSDVVPIVGLFAIPLIFFRYVNYIYDPMTLLVFAWCAYLIAKRGHLLYATIFPLAPLAKETAVLLILVFIAREINETTRRRTVLLSLWQFAVFVIIQLWLVNVFKGNPGSLVEYHLDHNLELLKHPPFYLKTLAVLAPIAILVAYRWTEKPLFLRDSLRITLIPLFALSIFLGYADELRGYYEVYPFALLLMLPTAVETLGISTWPTRSPAD